MAESNKDKGKVILLPSSIDHYQDVLTQMLESDRFREARELLGFLLGCNTNDEQIVQEWSMLYSWLNGELGAAPDGEAADRTAHGDANTSERTEWDETEADLLEQHVEARSKQDEQYVHRLLHKLQHSRSVDEQMFALEQLAHVKQPELNEPLLNWLKSASPHPLLQFKAMQTLRRRGYEGVVTANRNGKTIQVEAADVPLSMDDYPRLVQSVLRTAEQACEAHFPGMVYFMGEIWSEFLAAVFGTPVYDQLAGMDEEDVAVWAAALHDTAQEMIGSLPDVGDLQELYGLEASDLPAWERCCRMLREGIAALHPGE